MTNPQALVGKAQGLPTPLTSAIHARSPRDPSGLEQGRWFWITICIVAASSLLMLYLPPVRQMLLPLADALLLPIQLAILPLAVLCDCLQPTLRGCLARYRSQPAAETASVGSRDRLQRCWTMVMRDFCGVHPIEVIWLLLLRRAMILLVLLPIGWLCWEIYQNHFLLANGEPFEWAEGISVWPSTLIRGAAALLSLVMIFKGSDDLRRSREELFGDQAAPSVACTWRTCLASLRHTLRDVRLWDWKQAPDTADLLQEYTWRSLWQHRVLRAALLTATYFLFAVALFNAAENSPNARGRTQEANWWSRQIIGLSVLLCIVLVFFVIDATFLCRRFVGMLSQQRQAWRSHTLNATVSEIVGNDEDRQELATIRVIARQTNQVGKLLLYPFTTLLLLIVARHNVFDGWNMPMTLIVILGALFFTLVLHSLALRRAATDARRQVLRRLRGKLTEIADTDETRRALLEQLIADVKQEREGAFRPLADDYLFRGLAIPFGGTGGLLLLEHFIISGW